MRGSHSDPLGRPLPALASLARAASAELGATLGATERSCAVVTMSQSDWYSEGAVVVLLPQHGRDHWHGYYCIASTGQDYVFVARDGIRFRFPRDDAEAAGAQYDRAVAGLADTCAAIAVGDSTALLIDGQGGQARWLAAPAGDGGIWASLTYAPSTADALAALADVPETGFTPLLTLDLASGAHCFQDAGRHGHEAGVERVMAELRGGAYSVSRLDFAPNPTTRWLLHRLASAGS